MRVAFYCPMKPISHPHPSGDREIARGLYSFLQAQGAAVHILSEFRAPLFFQSWKGRWNWLKALWRAYSEIRQSPPDVFFTYHSYYKAPDAIGAILAWWFDRPYFIFEGIYARKAPRRWGFWSGYFLNKFALNTATRIFSDKTEDFEFLVTWFGAERIRHLPPSIDVTKYAGGHLVRQSTRTALKLADSKVAIVTVAMLRADRKTEGVRFLIDALEVLKNDGVEFEWFMIGDGVCFEEVRALARQKLGSRAHLLGAKDSDEVASLLSGADVFAFPGLDESFGLVYVEAQAAGLPVVAFRNGGIPDAVNDGVTARLTPVLELQAYTAALKTLILDQALRETMSAKASTFAEEKFSRARNYRLLWEELSASLSKSKPTPNS